MPKPADNPASLLQMTPKPLYREAENAESDNEEGKEDGINSFGATVHILRGSIGSGFLLMPYTMKNQGYVTGTLVLFTVAILYYHICHVIVSLEHRVCKQLKVKSLSYLELADEVFKRSPYPINKFRGFTRYSLYFLIGIPTAHSSFLVLIAGCIQILIYFFGLLVEIQYIMTVVIVPLTLLCMSRKILEVFVPYSNLSNICTLLMAFIVIVSSVYYKSKPSSAQPFASIAAIPESVAIYAKTFRFTTLILSIKQHMVHPAKYTHIFGPLNIAASIITLFYYSFGVILYYTYGDQVQDNVLYNMHDQKYLTLSIYILYTLALIVTYVLVFYGRIDNLWSGVVKQKFQDKIYTPYVENGLYIGFNLGAYLLAVFVPNFALISAITGTMAIPLELALPLIMELLIRSKDGDNNWWVIAKNSFIIGVSTALCFLSCKDIVMIIVKNRY